MMFYDSFGAGRSPARCERVARSKFGAEASTKKTEHLPYVIVRLFSTSPLITTYILGITSQYINRDLTQKQKRLPLIVWSCVLLLMLPFNVLRRKNIC